MDKPGPHLRVEDIRENGDVFDYSLRIDVASDSPRKVRDFCERICDLALGEPRYSRMYDVAVSVHRAVADERADDLARTVEQYIAAANAARGTTSAQSQEQYAKFVTWQAMECALFAYLNPKKAKPRYRLEGDLPKGLTFNEQTGVISGTPEADCIMRVAIYPVES